MKRVSAFLFVIFTILTLSALLIHPIKEVLADNLVLPFKFTMDSQSEVLAQTTTPAYQDVNSNVQISGNVGINAAPSALYRLRANGNTMIDGNLGVNASPSATYRADIGGDLRVNNAGSGSLYMGNRGYRIYDDNSGSDINIIAPDIYIATSSSSTWRKVCVNGDTSCVTGGGGGGSTLPTGTSGQTLRHNGTSWIANSNLYNSGTNIGIGTTTPDSRLEIADIDSVADLDYAGSLRISSGAPQIDFIDSDNVDWAIHANSDRLYFIRSDWDYDDLVLYNGNVGIGNASPALKLDVAGWVNSSADGAFGQGGFRMNYHTLNSNSNGWLYIGNQDGAVYGGRGLAADDLWANDDAYIQDRLRISGTENGWGTSIINGRVWSADSNIHLSPPGGNNVVIDGLFREAGGSSGTVGLCLNGSCITSWPTSTNYGASGGLPSPLINISQLNDSAGWATPRDTWLDVKIFTSKHMGTRLMYKMDARADYSWAGNRIFYRWCYGATVGNKATSEYDPIVTNCGQAMNIGMTHNGDRTDVFQGVIDINGAPDGSMKYVVLQMYLSSDQAGSGTSYQGGYWWGNIHYLSEI